MDSARGTYECLVDLTDSFFPFLSPKDLFKMSSTPETSVIRVVECTLVRGRLVEFYIK